MRKLIIAISAALVLSSLSGNAQVISHSRGDFFMQGRQLTEAEIYQLIGEEVYYDTYTGASRQRKAGQIMMITGGVTCGVGIASAIMGLAMTYRSQPYNDGSDYYTLNALVPLGYAATIVGSLLLDAGIPLFIIGNSRLNWIERDYNRRSGAPLASVNFGSTPHGMGLTVNF